MSKTFDEILKEINEDNLWQFEELKEIDSDVDVESEPKYRYVTYTFLHEEEQRALDITIQQNASGEVDICSDVEEIQWPPEPTKDELYKEMYNLIYWIGNDYVELSHDKVMLQRNEYITKCKELLKKIPKP